MVLKAMFVENTTDVKKLGPHIPPGPLSDFSMNLFFAKQVHHLLGLPSAVSNTFSHTLWPGDSINMNEINNSLYFLLTCFMSQL